MQCMCLTATLFDARGLERQVMNIFIFASQDMFCARGVKHLFADVHMRDTLDIERQVLLLRPLIFLGIVLKGLLAHLRIPSFNEAPKNIPCNPK